MFDLLIRNGLVIDGSGNPGYHATVGVEGDEIRVRRGDTRALPAARTIDAGGHVVCPGFIDMHSHGRLVILKEPLHDVYMTLALCAVNTERIRFGPRVITPVTRHPAGAASAAATLEELATGRTLVAIGSSDSAAYNLGLRPASLAELREYTGTIRALLATGRAAYHGKTATLTWQRARLPIYLAASGPKTLHLAGQIADGW